MQRAITYSRLINNKHVDKFRIRRTLKSDICDFAAPVVVLMIITADTALLLAQFTYANEGLHMTI
jgi:hypothetical protein